MGARWCRGEVSVVIEGATQAAADVNLLVPAVEDLVAAGGATENSLCRGSGSARSV